MPSAVAICFAVILSSIAVTAYLPALKILLDNATFL
jgi:hypothetical protein